MTAEVHELSNSYGANFEIHAETNPKLTFCLLEHDSWVKQFFFSQTVDFQKIDVFF